MSMEANLQALIVARCPRAYPVVVQPPGFVPARPYVVWQPIGGRSLDYVENTQASQRNTLMQVSVWADSSKAASDLIRLLEADLMASTAMTATPQGEPLAQYDEDTKYFGAVQRFSIYAPRT